MEAVASVEYKVNLVDHVVSRFISIHMEESPDQGQTTKKVVISTDYSKAIHFYVRDNKLFLECVDSSRQLHQIVLYDFNITERKPAKVRVKTDEATGLVMFEGEEY